MAYEELDKITIDMWENDEDALPPPERRKALFHQALTKTADEPYAMRKLADGTWFLHPTWGAMSQEELEYLAMTSVALHKRLRSLDRVESVGSRLPVIDRDQLEELTKVLLSWHLFRPDEEF